MKRAKNLFESIADFENLFRAYRRARRGKRYREYALDFDARLEENLLGIRKDLLEETYEPSSYRIFRIRDPKPREIAAPRFRDRVVHHAFSAVVEPVFERTFIGDSYACRVGRGTHKALNRCQEFARRFPYVLQCDVRKYFPSIDHAILIDLLARRIADEKILRLARTILSFAPEGEAAIDYFPGDDLFTPLERRRGIPIGSLTSQFFANLYLDPLDHYVKETLRVRGYVRYMDDFLLFGETKMGLACLRDLIRRFLESLRLELHPGKQEIHPVRCGIPFLGFRVFPDRRRIKRENVTRFLRRMKKKREEVRSGAISEAKYRESLLAWIAHAEHGETRALRKALFCRLAA